MIRMGALFALARRLGTAALIMACAAAGCGFAETHSELFQREEEQMTMGRFPLVSEIMTQSHGRTVEILNAIRSGSADEKTDPESPRGETEPPAEAKEDSK